MLKRLIKILLWITGILLLLCAVVFFISWKSPKYYVTSAVYDPANPLVSFQDYTTEHTHPYIIRGEGFILFGGSHTRDPQSPEIAQISEEWEKLRPTVALVEGHLGFLLPPLMDPVKNLGEGGKVKELAERDGIPIYNWDLSKEALAERLKGRFIPEQIALAQILNPYFSNLRFGRPDSPEKFIEEYLKRAAYVGQEENFKTPADVERIWEKYFPEGPDWQEVSDEYGLPGYIGEMAAATNDFRNQQLVTVVKDLLTKGERVFAIMGSSHAVCIAPSFQKK